MWNTTSVYFPENAPLYVYDADTQKYTVTAYAAHFDGGTGPSETKSGTYTFSASEAYNDGFVAGSGSGGEEAAAAERALCHSNLALTTAGSFMRTGNSIEYIGGYIGFVGSDGKSYTKALTGINYDATPVYSDGYTDAIDSATFSVSGTNVVVTFGDGTELKYDVKDYVRVEAQSQYVSSTNIDITVRAVAYGYFNDEYVATSSAQGKYDTAD